MTCFGWTRPSLSLTYMQSVLCDRACGVEPDRPFSQGQRVEPDDDKRKTGKKEVCHSPIPKKVTTAPLVFCQCGLVQVWYTRIIFFAQDKRRNAVLVLGLTKACVTHTSRAI